LQDPPIRSGIGMYLSFTKKWALFSTESSL
jgi:hypothetical protein